ncbi:hypothetical protein [Chlamydiifrater volucris]|uniref:hypothetical protein n=1 Tax=Chlamydiifrater volucris TaxID=2681470 RepID=UPI0032B30A17
MSISKSFGSEHSERHTPVPLSIREQIAVNAQLIQEMTLNPPFFPLYPDITPEKEALRSQLFSMTAKGFSTSLIARALAVSGIYLRTIITQNTALTEEQYYKVLFSCQDLSEASGSSIHASLPPPSTSLLEIPEELESRPEGDLLCHIKESVATEKITQITEPPLLPFKKRKTWQVFFTPAQSPEPEKPQSPPSPHTEDKIPLLKGREKTLAQLSLVMDAVALQKESDPPYIIPCPRREGKKKHVCSLCTLANRMLSSQTNTSLLEQLFTLLVLTPRDVLLETLASLLEEKQLPPLSEKDEFSRLEIAHIASRCDLGDEICLPETKNPATQISIYQSIEDVIKAGPNHPLTTTLKTLWNSYSPVKSLHKLLVQEKSGQCVPFSPSSLVPTLESLTLRACYRGRRKDKSALLHPSYANFVSNLTALSSQALINSPLGSPHLVLTSSGAPAIPRSTMQHIYSLILATNSIWKVEVLPTVLSETPIQILSLPEEDLPETIQSIKNFITVNDIKKPQSQLFLSPPEKQTRKRSAGALVATSPPLTREEDTLTKPQEKESEQEVISGKRKHKIRHTEDVTTHTEQMQEPEPSDTEATTDIILSQSQEVTALSFLIDFVIESRGRRVLHINCPQMTSETVQHVCHQCILAKRVLQRRSSLLMTQLERLLMYTSKEKLVRALMHLFSDIKLQTLGERHSLSNVELALLLRNCDIGDEVCVPGALNPASQAELYYAMEKVISSGLQEPLTSAILEVWKTSRSLLSEKDEEKFSILVLRDDENLGPCDIPTLLPIFTSLAQRYFLKKESRATRGVTISSMSDSTARFVAKATICTLKAFAHSPLAVPYQVLSPLGWVFPWKVVVHIFSIILSSNESWKTVVLPSRISPVSSQELSFSQEEISEVLPCLKRFLKRNKIFLPGKSPFSKQQLKQY